MRLDYINPILDSVMAALAEVTGGTVHRGDMKLQRRSDATREVATIISMTGEMEGRVIIDMSNQTALSIAGLLNQSTFTELDDLALDTLMEVSNIVVARAVSALNDRGFDFCLSPPLICTGSNLACFSSLNLETLVIPLQANAGDLNVTVALRMHSL
jgi:chemotaxis protein CheX